MDYRFCVSSVSRGLVMTLFPCLLLAQRLRGGLVTGIAVHTRNFLPISGKFLVTEAVCDGNLMEYIFSRGLMLVFVVPYVCLLYSYVYWLYNVCIDILTLDAGLLDRSQYPEGPATGHLDTGFSWFPCVYKRMLRWFPSFQVATTCFSCIPPDLNFLVTFFFISVYM